MSILSEAPSPGAIVQIAHSDGLVLAIVEGAAKGRIRVHTESGECLSVSPLKVVRVSRFEIEPPITAERAAGYLDSLCDAIKEHLEVIDLETIWDVLVAEGGTYTAEDIADLWFGEVDSAAYFAVEAALEDDELLFQRKGAAVHPRSQDEVDRLRALARAQTKSHDERRQFVADAAQVLAAQSSVDPPGLKALPEYGRFLDLLLNFAAHGDTYEGKKEAQRLLADLGRCLGSRLGRSANATFKLLMSLGIVEEHENLALRRYGIRSRFSADDLARAQDLAVTPVVIADGLTTFEDETVFTIDAEETRDMDDALHVELLPNGEVEVGVHISDVGDLVEPGSALDKSARRRGASLYLPTGVIPMFPRALSEERLSLIQGQTRPTLSYRVRLDAAGNRLSASIVRSHVTVSHRLTYEEAETAIDDPSHVLHTELARLADLTATLKAKRDANGAIVVALPEIRTRVRGDVVTVEKTPPSRSRKIIAELMVLAGEVTAEFSRENQIPSVYRTQAVISSPEELAYLEDIEDPLVRALEQVRHMRRGELRSQPEPHHGLGLAAYSTATSPMRRYADLVVNYQLRRFLGGEGQLCFDEKRIIDVAGRAEAAAQASASAQRESVRYWLLEYLRRNSDQPVEAMVLFGDPRNTGPTVPVVLPDTMVRANLRVRGLEPGHRLQVRVARADPRQNLLQLEPS